MKRWPCFVVLCVLPLAGCVAATDGPAPTAAATSPTGGATAVASFDAQRVLAATDRLSSSEEYRVSPLDVIEITVFDVPKLDRTAQVNSNGSIVMPLIGEVRVSGKTTPEIEREIARRLRATYLQDPRVGVSVKEFTSQRVTMDGAVEKPGIYSMTGSMSLIQAVAQAGGVSEIADRKGIYVFRTVNDQREVARFDLDAIRKGAAPDPALEAGDIVIVDESVARTVLRDLKSVLPVAGFFRPLW